MNERRLVVIDYNEIKREIERILLGMEQYIDEDDMLDISIIEFNRAKKAILTALSDAVIVANNGSTDVKLIAQEL